MSRIKIELPQTPNFNCKLRIRITDINYGNHLANHAVLEIAHEARILFYESLGYTELNLDGAGTVMSDAAIQFINEGFHGEELHINIYITGFTRVGFDLYYLFSKSDGKEVCRIKTGIVCFDYTARKVIQVPQNFVKKFQ